MKTSIKLSKEEIEHLALLANLPLSPNLISSLVPSLSTVIAYVSKIQSLNTTGVVETSQVTGQDNVFREDVVEEKRMLSQKEALSNTKKEHNGYFVIEAIFEE